MGAQTELVTNDTGSSLVVNCKDNTTGLAIDLTGSTVRLRWKNGLVVETRTMTITNAVNGQAKYTFLTGEIIAPKMAFEVEITDSTGKVLSNLKLIEVLVRRELG